MYFQLFPLRGGVHTLLLPWPDYASHRHNNAGSPKCFISVMTVMKVILFGSLDVVY